MFERRDFPTIMDGPVVRYRLEGGHFSGEINASRNGVSVCGTWPVFTSQRAVDEIIDTLKKARVHHAYLDTLTACGGQPGVGVLLNEQQVADTAGVSLLARYIEKPDYFDR